MGIEGALSSKMPQPVDKFGAFGNSGGMNGNHGSTNGNSGGSHGNHGGPDSQQALERQREISHRLFLLDSSKTQKDDQKQDDAVDKLSL